MHISKKKSIKFYVYVWYSFFAKLLKNNNKKKNQKRERYKNKILKLHNKKWEENFKNELIKIMLTWLKLMSYVYYIQTVIDTPFFNWNCDLKL